MTLRKLLKTITAGRNVIIIDQITDVTLYSDKEEVE